MTSTMYPGAVMRPPPIPTGGVFDAVVDFGAVGDNVTDDYAALQRAINALSAGTTLIIPPRTYKTSATLYVNQSNVTILGYGATIRNVTNAVAVLVVVGSASPVQTDTEWRAMHATANYGNELTNVVVEGLTGVMQPNSIGGANITFVMSWANDSTFRRLVVTASNGNAIEMEQCDDSTIERCKISGYRAYGIFIFQCLRPTVRRNKIVGGGTPTTGARGIVVKQTKNGNPSGAPFVDGNTLIDIGSNDYWIVGGERFENVLTDPIYVAGHEVVADARITNNRLRRVSGSFAPAISIAAFASRWRVEGNRGYANGASGFALGVGVQGNPSDGGTIGEDHQIADNTFAGYNAAGNALVSVGVACQLEGNIFNGSAQYTVYAANATGASISSLRLIGNTFRVSQYLQFANANGVYAGADVDDLVMDDNVFEITSATNGGLTVACVVYSVAKHSDIQSTRIRMTRGSDTNTTSVGIELAGGGGFAAFNHVAVDATVTATAYVVDTLGYTLLANTAESIAGATTRRGFKLNVTAVNDYPRWVGTFEAP